MRYILVILLLHFFATAGAQLNRSANQLARESAREYVVNLLFKKHDYQPISFGTLKAWDDRSSVILWTLEHRFEIIHRQNSTYGKSTEARKLYDVVFYLDKRMKVLKAVVHTSQGE